MKKLICLLLIFSFLSLSAQNEATTDEIQHHNGLVYKNNVPYTGILYKDSPKTNNDCKCTLEAHYTAGLLNGSKKEYYSNGKLKFLGQYIRGKEQGEHLFYDSNGTIESKDKYSNGKKLSYVTLNPLSIKDALYYLLAINEPDNYDDAFFRSYLYKFDPDFQNYVRNEFELKRKINDIKPVIKKELKNVNFNTVYISAGSVPLSRYSFDTNSYKLNLRFEKAYNDNSINLFQYSKMHANKLRIAGSAPHFYFDNPGSFQSIDLSPDQAENLKNSLSQNMLYYTYEYKVLPKIIKHEQYNTIMGISATILKVVFYADKEFSKTVYTIDKSSDFSAANVATYKKKTVREKTQPTPQVNRAEIKKKTNQYDNLEKAAEEGNVESQFDLANLYFEGKGVPKDNTKAFYWYKKSAENGFVNAQEALAAMYYLNKDFKNAVNWYSKAGNANHPRAQYVLGSMYLNGVGVKKSRKNAKYWWKKSCSLGYADSCVEVKKMNALGNAILNSINESIPNHTPDN